MNKKIVISFGVSLCIFVLIFALQEDATNEVRIAYPPIVASLPIFIALEQELFEKSGIKIKRVVFQSSNEMVNALVTGKVDVLPAVSLIPIIHLEIRYPGRIRSFSHSKIQRDNAFDSIIVKKDSPIGSLEDLEGKKVGIFPGSSSQTMLTAFLRDKGVNPNNVKLVPLSPQAQLNSLASEAIDALFSYEPITTTATVDPNYRRLHGSVFAELISPCPIGSSAISRRFEKNNPDLARKVISILDESVIQLRKAPGKFKALLPQFTSIKSEVAPLVNHVDVTLSSEINLGNLQSFVNILHKIGEIPEELNAERLVRLTK